MVSGNEAVSVKASKTSAASSPSRAASGRDSASSSSTIPPFFSPPQSKLLKALNNSPSPSKQVLPGLECIIAPCWQLMLEEGWETMTQADGQDLYKMPGINFFAFRPNENVFDSLVKACNKYLRDWAQSAHEDESEQSKLLDFLWPMVEKSGWVKILSSNETWYMMPNTPFDKFVPNVTIFQSKALAVSKYLEVSGVLQVEDTNSQVVEIGSASSSSLAAAEVDNQVVGEDMDVDESEDDEESASEDSSSEVDVESGENNDERSDESEEEEEIVVQAKPKRASSRAKRPKSVPAAKPKATASKTTVVTQWKLQSPTPAKKLKFSKPRVTIPPFKLTFGKIESELRDRGWYWKPSGADWRYFKPSCRSQNVSALQANVDYFDSRPLLEDHLDESKLYDEIRTKLCREHAARYAQSSDSEDDDEEVSEDDEEEVSPKQKQVSKRLVAPASPSKKKHMSIPISAPALPPTPVSTLTSSTTDDEASKENRSDNVMPRRSRTSQPFSTSARLSSSRRSHTSMCPDALQVKFGDIWKALEEQGWHHKPGKFEYDYFKPNCQDTSEGIQNDDYFPSRDMLVMYLQSSGIWDKTAKKLAREDAIDLTSSDDDEKKSEPVSKPASKRQAPFKRKSNAVDRDSDDAADERTPASKSTIKKTKLAGTFSTPTEQKRSISDIADDDNESDNADNISPETGAQKATAQDNSTSSSLPRKLVDCFTPSPGTLKKNKSSSATLEQIGPLELFTDAIQKLTLGYSSSKFKYRDEESRRVHDFFQTCFTEQHGSSMYISGAPGCGKSALLKASEDRITQIYQVRSVLMLTCSG